jgi:hypothetical protein
MESVEDERGRLEIMCVLFVLQIASGMQQGSNAQGTET